MHHFFYFFEKAIPKGFTNKTIERKLVGRLKILKNNAEVRKHEEIAMVLVELNDLTEPLVKVNPDALKIMRTTLYQALIVPNIVTIKYITPLRKVS